MTGLNRIATFVFLWLAATGIAGAAPVVPEFKFTDVRVTLINAAGQPIPRAALYGWCARLGLLWPRPHAERSQYFLLWGRDRVDHTDDAGQVTARVPPGDWFFMAAGAPSDDPTATPVAAWASVKVGADAPTILRLRPAAARELAFRTAKGSRLMPGELLIKPAGAPVFFPIPLPSEGRVELSSDPPSAATLLWAAGDASASQPAFVLDFGRLPPANDTPKPLVPAAPPVTITCQGVPADGARLTWLHDLGYGLDGAVRLLSGSSLLVSPGPYAFAYTRAVGTADVTARVSTIRRTFNATDHADLDLASPLTFALDQGAFEDGRTCARLYVTDAAGNVLGDFAHGDKPLKVRSRIRGDVGDARQFDPGDLCFRLPKDPAGARWEWEVDLPAGTGAPAALVAATHQTFRSRHFELPAVPSLGPAARAFLAEADDLEHRMRKISGRSKRKEITEVFARPHSLGASGTHDGTRIRVGPVFTGPLPADSHGFAHELGHNFGLTHGGLMEMLVEASRAESGAPIQSQDGKWLFLDRMNGQDVKETWYPHTAFFAYCAGVGGPAFVRGASLTFPRAAQPMSAAGFTPSETEAGLCAVRLGMNLADASVAYGLVASPERYRAAESAARHDLPPTLGR